MINSMEMRPVVLVTLDWERPGDGWRNFGAASIVASLETAGVEIVWITVGGTMAPSTGCRLRT